MIEKYCIACDSLIEDEDYFVDESLDTYYCYPCGVEEKNKEE